MKFNRTYIAVVGALVLVLAVGGVVYTSKAPALQPAPQANPQGGSILLSVQGLYTHKPVTITSGETVLQVLQSLDASDPQLQLSVQEYTGMGALVVGMHGSKNGSDKKYWQYTVNGVMPQIGAAGYKLKNGDSVEWIFGSSRE